MVLLQYVRWCLCSNSQAGEFATCLRGACRDPPHDRAHELVWPNGQGASLLRSSCGGDCEFESRLEYCYAGMCAQCVLRSAVAVSCFSLGHPVKGAAGARHGCLDPSHTRSINMPRHDPGSWAVLGDRAPARMGITMTIPAHAQGHAGPAWLSPGGLEPTILGLEVRRRIHDAKGAAMLERLRHFSLAWATLEPGRIVHRDKGA